MNQNRVHWLTTILLSYIVCLSSGCSVWRETNRVYDLARRTTQVEPRYYEYIHSDKVAQREARLLAKQAWAENPMNGSASADYKNGFSEGFADYLYRGGSGEPPVIPPRGYWNLRFLNQFGKVSVNDWYEGFRAGAADCKARGLREMWLIPTSLVVDDPASEAATSVSGEWYDDETWDEETYRKRVEERQQEKNRLESLRDPEDPPIPADDSGEGVGPSTDSEDDGSSSEDDSTEPADAVDALQGTDSSDEPDGDLGIDLGPALDMVPDIDDAELDAAEDRGAFDLQPENDTSTPENEEDSGSDNNDLLMDDLFESTSSSNATDSSQQPAATSGQTLPDNTSPATTPNTETPGLDDAIPLDLPGDGGSDPTELDFDALQSRSNRKSSTSTELAFRTTKRNSTSRARQSRVNQPRTKSNRTQQVRSSGRRDSSVRQVSGVESTKSSSNRNPVRNAGGQKQAKPRPAAKRSTRSASKNSSNRGRASKPTANRTSRSSGAASLLFFEPEEKQNTQTLDFSEPLPDLPLQLESTDVIYWDPVTGEQSSHAQHRTNAAQLRVRQQQTVQAQARASITKNQAKPNADAASKSRRSTINNRYASPSRKRNPRQEIDPADLVFDSDHSSAARRSSGFDVRPLPPQTGNQQQPSKFASWDPMEGVEEHGFADLDRSKFKSVLSNEVLEQTTRWTPEMGRSAELPERVADTGTRMSPKRSNLQAPDRPSFENVDAKQDAGLRQQLNVALRDKSFTYRRSASNASKNERSNYAPVVDAMQQPARRIGSSTKPAPRFYRAGDNDLPMVIDRENLPRSATQATSAVQLRLRD